MESTKRPAFSPPSIEELKGSHNIHSLVRLLITSQGQSDEAWRALEEIDPEWIMSPDVQPEDLRSLVCLPTEIRVQTMPDSWIAEAMIVPEDAYRTEYIGHLTERIRKRAQDELSRRANQSA